MSTALNQLAHSDAGLELSHEEFVGSRFDEPWRYERAAGRLLVTPPSGDDHVTATEPFLEALFAYKAKHPDVVERIVPEAWLWIDDETDRIPDIGVYLAGGRDRRKIPDRVPEIAVEIVSEDSRHRDYIEKRLDYSRAGVKEYVIVDPIEHRLVVLRRERGRYRETVLSPQDTYTSPLLPGFSLALRRVLS